MIYKDIVKMISDNWLEQALLDDVGNEILRIKMGEDNRIGYIHEEGSETAKLVTDLHGDDPEVTLPQVVTGSRVYNQTGELIDELLFEDPFELEMNHDFIRGIHSFKVGGSDA